MVFLQSVFPLYFRVGWGKEQSKRKKRVVIAIILKQEHNRDYAEE
jgi:hypothetical protein